MIDFYSQIAKSNNFFLLAGPCVVESKEVCKNVVEHILPITQELQIPYAFKASFKKANRSRIDSFTGIGDLPALEIIANIRKEYNVPVVTDVHSVDDVALAAPYVDILQIPAFLCRQTDLLVAAAKTGKIVNIKKGQFLAPSSMIHAATKVFESGNEKIMITDRGTMFGYGDLIVDYRGIPIMQKFNYPVILDITHSLQQPNRAEGVSGGLPELIDTIARAGIAVGVDGIFMETHPDPSKAKSDGANMLNLENAGRLLKTLSILKETINNL